MNKSTKNFVIDTTLLALLLASGGSGLLLWSGMIPKDTAIRLALKLIHKWGGLGLVVLATYHFTQHWDWYVKTGKGLVKEEDKAIYS